MDSFRIRNDNGYPSGPLGQDVQNIRAISLDLDDTLWEIAPVIRRAEQRLHQWYVEHYPRIVEKFDHSDMLELRNAVVGEHKDKRHDLTFIRCAVIERLGAAAGYSNFPVDEAFAVFDEARNDVELFHDVRPALESLGQRFTLIAVTNGNANLEKIGIRQLFDGFVSARKAGAAKPSLTIFSAAIEAGGASAAETLHVGDDPHTDVDGARSAGMRAVWINRKGHAWPGSLTSPDGTVADLFELDRLLDGADH